MGTALRKLKSSYRGPKLEDGKTIGGAGRLTDALINSLQNYYGDAIRRNKGDVGGMMRAVQASLLHCNSTDETPRHHLCPKGIDSWCRYQKAQALGYVYLHKEPIPKAIVDLLKPIYARLGSKSLMEKCVDSFTQNANESLHSIVWRFCPKAMFLGRVAVELACALAVCEFNDGMVSLAELPKSLQLCPTPFCETYLKHKDSQKIKRSLYKSTDDTKKRRVARKKRKGLEDKHARKEGVMYAPGEFFGGVEEVSSDLSD